MSQRIFGAGPSASGESITLKRSGNSFVANPGLMRKASAGAVEAAAAAAKNTDVAINDCATMGEKLVVRPGAELIVPIVVRDPQGKNNAPYGFANPSLKQIGMMQPINEPVLDHIDVIGGNVTGYVDPADTAACSRRSMRPPGLPLPTAPAA